MSRIKIFRLFSFVLAILLLLNSVVFASEMPTPEPQDIISPDQMTSEQIDYETVEVTRGTLNLTVNTVAFKYYPVNYDIRYPYDGAKFAEYTVHTGDRVKKGDILVKFNVTASEAEFTRMQLGLQRAEEQITEGIRMREKEIERKREALNAASDKYEKEIAELSLKKAELELKQFKLRQERSIQYQREAYNKENTRRKTDVLVSPADGVISALSYKQPDDPVTTYETLLTVTSEENMMFVVSNESGAMQYNTPIEIRLGNGTDAEWVTGRVVATDNLIPANERPSNPEDRKALVQPDVEGIDVDSLKSLKVAAENIRIDNVLLVHNRAVKTVDGRPCVTKLIDGVPQTWYVKTALRDTEGTWILEGVEEGETLILD